MADLITVDACGLYCPLPIIRLAAAARGAAPGTEMELLADDPGVREDLPAWCTGHGHTLVSLEEDSDGVIRSRVRVGERQSG